ncbi:MAG: PAC2 family protein [Bifidobacteriaceae bacterium]|nr:PAC2 family protein [Bifidobacteriaceae bacterium]
MSTAIAAFAGWNDAGSAATDAVAFLLQSLDANLIDTIGGEEYCDFQVNRPQCRIGQDGKRHLIWPSTDFWAVEGSRTDPIMLIRGVEPSFHWNAFTEEVLVNLDEYGIDRLLVVGALLADVPHSRAIPVQVTSESRTLRDQFGAEKPTYEGPTGILSVLEQTADRAYSIESMALWAPVPHYVASPPSPKAQLALVEKLAEILGLEDLDTAELAEEAKAWAEGVDSLAASDPEVAGYIASLEAANDALDSPAASGEALAKEFERYLRRRGTEGTRGP